MFKKTLLATAFAASTILSVGSAMAATIAGSSGGDFSNLTNCSGGDCSISNTSNGNNTRVNWGSTSSSTNLVNPSTLTSVDLSFGPVSTTATNLRIGQLQWFNNATLSSQTDPNFNVNWNFSIVFTQPVGSADPNGSETFNLNILSPTNSTGDNVVGLTLAHLDPGLILSLNGVTISNLHYEVEDLGGNSGASGCGGDDTSFNSSTGNWYNCEGNTANLFIVGTFTATTTSVPEPMTLGLMGLGLAGLGFAARRRRAA